MQTRAIEKFWGACLNVYVRIQNKQLCIVAHQDQYHISAEKAGVL